MDHRIPCRSPHAVEYAVRVLGLEGTARAIYAVARARQAAAGCAARGYDFKSGELCITQKAYRIALLFMMAACFAGIVGRHDELTPGICHSSFFYWDYVIGIVLASWVGVSPWGIGVAAISLFSAISARQTRGIFCSLLPAVQCGQPAFGAALTSQAWRSRSPPELGFGPGGGRTTETTSFFPRKEIPSYYIGGVLLVVVAIVLDALGL